MITHVPLARLLNQQTLRKVPEITVYFWIIKLLSTAVGESASDFLVFHIDPYIAVALGAGGLAVALILQLSARRYRASLYWLAVVMVGIFGTMAADVVHVALGVPYVDSAAFFAVTLAVIFATWYACEKTLSIHSIFTLRRELFYWAAVMATFALGTATGDLTAATLNLGYLNSGVLFALLFAVPALGYWWFHFDEIFAFWFAYIMTRPLGASFADWTGRAPDLGGIGIGTGRISVILVVFIIIFVVYLTVTRLDVKSETASDAPAPWTPESG